MGLGRKHNIRKAAILKVLDEALARHHELFGLREVVALGNILLKRARVHANANRTARGTRSIDHRVNLGPIADIAGIDAQLGGTGLNSTNGELMVKVDIGDNRHRRLGTDGAEASSAASEGTLTRTISQPACANAHTCASVAWASAVSVQVIDWTTTARRHRSARRPHARGASAREAKDGIKTIQTLPYRINRRMSERSI